MGWIYPNGADMSAYKYLVVNLKRTQSCDAHINLFPTNNIWGDCYSSPAFGSKKQLVINLQTATYTSGNNSGNPIDASNIHIVSLWSNGTGYIYVDDIFLTNNDDYTPPTDIEVVNAEAASYVNVFTLSGQRVRSHVAKTSAVEGLPAGLYLVGNRKVLVK
ncbi:MAG: hypothetical protein Q4E32_03780 [Bacteroidales bacterium]|nr:hypothetical protein [Bacteroidales bacterium]